MHSPFPMSVLLFASLVAGSPATAGTGGDGGPLIERVGGDRRIRTELKVDRFTCGESLVEAALPTGYPAPTPPGAIDLKRYPSVRRAEVSGAGDPDRDRDGAFWSLFNHIKSREIAMTSPVELDLRGGEGWTMSFLYRESNLGPTGGDGRVSVVDTEPATFLSIGMRGPYGSAMVERGVARLREWLEGQEQWVAGGDPRALYYNGPYIPDDRKWAEVQIPVRRVGAPDVAPDAAPEAMTEASGPSPARMIELAVERGAPLFNDRQPEACAAIYEITARWLLEAVPQLDAAMRSRLETALAEMRREADPRKQAWTLRHALDEVYWDLVPAAQASRG